MCFSRPSYSLIVHAHIIINYTFSLFTLFCFNWLSIIYYLHVEYNYAWITIILHFALNQLSARVYLRGLSRHPRGQTKWRRESNMTTVGRLPSTSSFPSTCWCSCPCRTSYYQRRRIRRKTVGMKAPCVFGASTIAKLSCWYLSST